MPSLRRAAVTAPAAPLGGEELWTSLLAGSARVVDRFDSRGRRYFVIGPPLIHQLSPRERQVIEGVATGRPNKVIAYDLGLSLGSVSGFLSSALRKLGLRRVDVVVLAGTASGGPP